MWQLPLPRRMNAVARYATSAGVALAAFLIRLPLADVIGNSYPYMTFFWAVTIAAWLGGFWPGMAAVLFSAVGSVWLLIEPTHSFRVASARDFIGLALFGLTGAMLCFICEGFRRAVETSLMSAVRARASAREADLAREREKSILESIADGFIAYDQRWRILFVNQPAAELLGYRREELPGKNVVALFPNPVLSQSYPLMRKAIEENVPTRFEFSLPSSDRWFESVVYPSPAGASVFTRETTSERKLAAAVRESETRFRTLADSAPLLIWTSTPSGDRDYVNQPYLQFTGRTLEDELGDGWADLIHPSDRSRVLATYGHAVNARLGFTAEYRMRRSDGEYRWVLDTGADRKTADGISLGSVGSCLDITSRRQAEEALRESEAQLRLSMSVSHMGVWQYDVQTGIATCSPEISRILALPKQEITLQDIVNTAHPSDRATFAAVLARVVAKGGDYEAEYRQVRADGDTRWLLGRGQGFLDSTGRCVRVIGLTIDVTERKLIEERVRHAQKLESLGILAGGIAHDFNNLLTGILGSASLVLDDLEEGSMAREMQMNVISASERAAQLTSQMLAYSGRGQFVTESIDIGKLVRDNLRLVEASVQNKKISLQTVYSQEPSIVEGDPGQIQQVAMNLVLNAAEAIPADQQGEVRVTISTLSVEEGAPDLAPGQYVSLRVEDTGVGMDEETIARIFEPFFTTKFTGRGLGLAAVQGIVRGHKGAIRVTSTPGQGTVFNVLLPRVAVAAPARLDARDGWMGKGTILVVDDEETVRRTARAVLERYGFDVICAEDGSAAVDLFLADPDSFVAVLLDMTMPVMSGAEALHLMREARSTVKVIATSGFSESEAAERFAADGPDAFIQKPYSGSKLAAVVRMAIDGNASSATGD